MITSIFYFLCFVILLFRDDKGVRLMSVFGMAHIILENCIYWFFFHNPQYFDITLYMTACWLLDIVLLFLSTCVLKGWKKKLTLSLVIPILFIQMAVMQFPGLLPQAFDFVITSSYQTAMEVYILCSSFKDTTVKEWIKTSSILSLLFLARFIQYAAN